MRRLPPLHALRAFEAAARHLHFKNAAEELGLTPTAISHQVRQLEDILGVELFHRYPRPVRLSAAGERLFPVVRDSLDHIAGAVEELSAGDHDGSLKMSVTMAFASRWLLARLPRLRKEAGVEVMVEADDRIADLHGSGIDIAIRYAEYPSADAEWQKLFSDRIIPVCAPALLSDLAPLSAEQILKLPLLHYRWKSGSPNAPSWERWMTQAGLDIKARPAVQSFSEEIHAIEAAASGHGAVLASRHLVADLLDKGVLAQISDIFLPGHSYWAVFLPNHPRRDAIGRLTAWLKQQN
ncbi:LysR substrate-binding domain-containing protein [Candidatus Halocynthiibacter alkanivorans]|uniref:LysR substrate-binding domain-containing protein n=1 Tax=Candidatus Halocynthiibacter alkanivorans TaxID=2267619 RepID=UPI000DF1D584|nr:LysR substrate-binding domain-containing protein [Candidatus Halocynthiibacter alkanivorans]